MRMIRNRRGASGENDQRHIVDEGPKEKERDEVNWKKNWGETSKEVSGGREPGKGLGRRIGEKVLREKNRVVIIVGDSPKSININSICGIEETVELSVPVPLSSWGKPIRESSNTRPYYTLVD